MSALTNALIPKSGSTPAGNSAAPGAAPSGATSGLVKALIPNAQPSTSPAPSGGGNFFQSVENIGSNIVKGAEGALQAGESAIQPATNAIGNFFSPLVKAVGAGFNKAVNTPLGENGQSLSQTYSQAMSDLKGGSVAYAPAAEKPLTPGNQPVPNVPQGGTLPQLEKTQQQQNITDPVRRYGNDVVDTLLSTLQGASANIFKNPVTNLSPEAHVIEPLFQTAGQFYSITKLQGAAEGLLSKVPLINAIPKESQLGFIPKWLANVAGLDVYSQLDPNVQNRFQQFLNDAAFGTLLTTVGTIGKLRYSVPLAFGGGFAMAKLQGADNTHALVSGALLAALDAAGKIPGMFESQFKTGTREFTPQEARDFIVNSQYKNSDFGKAIVKDSFNAEAQGKNLEVNMTAAKQGAGAKLFKMNGDLSGKTPEGVAISYKIVEPSETAPAKLPETTTPPAGETQPTEPIAPKTPETPAKPVSEVVPTTKPAFTSTDAKGAQAEFTSQLDTIRETATSQADQIQKVNTALMSTLNQIQGNRNALAGVRTALSKEIKGFAGNSGNYKGDYAMLQTLKDNPDIGKYITTLEDHIATIDNMLFSSDKQNIENLQKMKEQLASIPQTVASTKLDTIIAELQTKEPFTGESQYALDLLTNADSFEEFSSSVETLGKEFDNEFTALHNDIVSGKVTAPLYERFRNEYRQSISYFSKQNSTLSSKSGNKGVEPSGGKQETENVGAKPQNTEGSQLNPEAKGSGNNGLGGRNGGANSEPTNRTAGNGTSVETPQDRLLTEEAKKYKTFEEFRQIVNGGMTQYGEYNPALRESIPAGYQNISELGIDPEETVTIYRGIDDLSGKAKRQINNGDFVTTDYESALAYTSRSEDVVQKEVKAKYLYNSEPKDFTDDPFYTGAEYIYTTKEVTPLPSSAELRTIWEKAHEEKPHYDFQSTQLNLPKEEAAKILDIASKIPEKDLYIDKAESIPGRETEPHITVLYGLDNSVTQEDIAKVVAGTKPLTVTFGKTSLFSNDKYDVLKVDVTSPELTALNKKIDSELPTPGATFPEYKPHATIAYLKKGIGWQYTDNPALEGDKVTLKELSFSKNDGTQITIPLREEGAEKLPEIPSPYKTNSVQLNVGFDPGLDKFVNEDVKEATKYAKGKANEIVKMLNFIKDGFINIIEPAKIVEIKNGADAYASVIRAIHTREAEELTFNDQKSQVYDKNFENLEKFFNRFSEDDLKTFNLTRGEAETAGGQAVQKAARDMLNPILQDPKIMQSIQDVSDYVFNWGKANGVDLNYFEDYFYGNYKPTKGSGSVENFLDYWKSTDKYVKEKKLPTIADAEDFGLELKNQNPITNLRQEMQAMAHRVGLMRLKTDNEAKQVGYMVAREGASVDQLQTWKKINDPVFNGYLFSPEYAKFVNNLIATNKISSNLFLKGLRQASFTFQQIKFFGSLYHLTNISKAAISDNPLGVANPSGYWQLLKSFKPVNKTDPQYKEYINLGGGHKYSIESAAEGQMMKALDKAGRGNYLGALLRLPVGIMQQKFIPASPGMIKWMFEDYIPAIKYNKYQQQVSIKQRQVKRELTDAEKIRIIKDNNNFYGEMNERLFGRSGTVTSALRLIFTAPSYGEGNFRTIFRAIPEKGHGRAAQFIYSSLLTSLVLGVVGTVIATGKWPDVPKKLSDVRDLWKIKTDLKDGNGDTVYFDQMGYAADYWSILGNLFTGAPGNIPGALTQRFAGMVASGAKLMTDLATLSEGNMVYDYKGTPMFLRTDDFTTKFSKFLQYEGLAIAPISTGTFQKSSQSGTNWLSSFFIAASGQKPTTSEAVKLTKASVQDLYALQTGKKNQQTALDKLYNENPPEAINQAKAFNRAQLTKIKQILHSQGATSISLSMLKQNYLITKLYKGAPKEGTTLKNMLQRQP